MSFPQSSRAWANPQHPEPWGVCDRCNFRYLRSQLVWQWDYRGGTHPSNLRILVCTLTCNDVPQEQLKTILISADPIPVQDPRPGWQNSQQGYTPVFTPLEIVSDDQGGSIIPPNHNYLMDGYGNYVLDGYGNKIIIPYTPSGTQATTNLFDGFGNPVLDGYGRRIVVPLEPEP